MQRAMEVLVESGFLATSDVGNLRQSCSRLAQVPILNEQALMRASIQRLSGRANLYREKLADTLQAAMDLADQRTRIEEQFAELLFAHDTFEVHAALARRDWIGTRRALREVDQRVNNARQVNAGDNADEESIGEESEEEGDFDDEESEVEAVEPKEPEEEPDCDQMED